MTQKLQQPVAMMYACRFVGFMSKLTLFLSCVKFVFPGVIHNFRGRAWSLEVAHNCMSWGHKRKSKTVWLGNLPWRHAKYKGPVKKKTGRRTRDENFFLREHTNKSWQWKRTCTSFAQQHKSACRNVHYHHAKRRIPLRECVVAPDKCSARFMLHCSQEVGQINQ